jgi:hypothetical protein
MELMRKINLVIGYLLLTPGVWSVFYFVFFLIRGKVNDQQTGEPIKPIIDDLLHTGWTGIGQHTSALPFYFAIMAIAGAYLITANLKDKENGNTRD